MYPPAGSLIRKASEDYKIPNSKHIIPKGMQIIVPAYAIHYDERYWENPKKFNPDRFTPENCENRPNEVFLPFGDGPRNCIGNRFALINVKFAVATIIKNFNVKVDKTKVQYPLKLNPTTVLLEPIGGFLVNFERI